eukprot:m51a1_g12011 hypothetical protein (172) ;mRNA; f:9-594
MPPNATPEQKAAIAAERRRLREQPRGVTLAGDVGGPVERISRRRQPDGAGEWGDLLADQAKMAAGMTEAESASGATSPVGEASDSKTAADPTAEARRAALAAPVEANPQAMFNAAPARAYVAPRGLRRAHPGAAPEQQGAAPAAGASPQANIKKWQTTVAAISAMKHMQKK